MKRPWERNGRIIENAAGQPIECEICPCPGFPPCPPCTIDADAEQAATVSIESVPCVVPAPWPRQLTATWDEGLGAWWYGNNASGTIDLGDGNSITINFLLTCVDGVWYILAVCSFYIDPCADCLGETKIANAVYENMNLWYPSGRNCIRVVGGAIVSDHDIVFYLDKIMDAYDCWLNQLVITIHLGA